MAVCVGSALPVPSWTVKQSRSFDLDVEVAVDLVELLVVDTVVGVVVVSWLEVDLSLEVESVEVSGSSEVESESGSSGSTGGGVGPPGGGLPAGTHPPPKPQLSTSGQSKGTIQWPVPPGTGTIAAPQISLRSWEHPQAKVGSEPSEVVTEVPVKTTLLVSSLLVTRIV